MTTPNRQQPNRQHAQDDHGSDEEFAPRPSGQCLPSSNVDEADRGEDDEHGGLLDGP